LKPPNKIPGYATGFIICTAYPVLFGYSNLEERDGRACNTCGERCIGVLLGKPEGKIQFGRARPRWEENIKMDLQELGWGACTGSIWLRIGRGGGQL
jgi:hypothetical protein